MHPRIYGKWAKHDNVEFRWGRAPLSSVLGPATSKSLGNLLELKIHGPQPLGSTGSGTLVGEPSNLYFKKHPPPILMAIHI